MSNYFVVNVSSDPSINISVVNNDLSTSINAVDVTNTLNLATSSSPNIIAVTGSLNSFTIKKNKILNDFSDPYNYLGFSSRFAATSESIWKIVRFTINAAGEIAETKEVYNEIWDNRYNINYY